MEEMAKMIAIAKMFGVLGTASGGASTVVVLEETTLERQDETEYGTSYVMSEPYASYPEAGKECTVNFNGQEYKCTAKPFDLSGIAIVVVGNTALFGEPDGSSDEPFIVAFVPMEYASGMGTYAQVVTAEDFESITISITQEASGGSGGASSGGGVLIITGTVTGEMSDSGEMYLSPDKTFAEIMSEVGNGSMPFFKVAMGDTALFALFAGYTSTDMNFVVNGGGGEVMVIKYYSPESDVDAGLCYMYQL